MSKLPADKYVVLGITRDAGSFRIVVSSCRLLPSSIVLTGCTDVLVRLLCIRFEGALRTYHADSNVCSLNYGSVSSFKLVPCTTTVRSVPLYL